MGAAIPSAYILFGGRGVFGPLFRRPRHHRRDEDAGYISAVHDVHRIYLRASALDRFVPEMARGRYDKHGKGF